jgi:hypothetical protein
MATNKYGLELGKLPATRLAGVSTLGEYTEGKLPAPPESVKVPGDAADYPMDGNDQWGDCTIAGIAHLLAAWDILVDTKSIAVPDAAACVSLYEQLTGSSTPPGPGLNETTLLAQWRTQGLFGNEIDAYAPVDYKNIVELHQAIAFYGAAYLGIVCPESAQQQFQDNQPWTYVAGSPVEGGHCIVALGYTPTALLCATWGGIAEVTYPFLAHYLDESFAIISPEYADAKQTPKLDLAALKQDLDNLQKA